MCTLRDQISETDADLLRAQHILSSLRGPILRFRLLFNFYASHQSASLERCLRIILKKGALHTFWVFNTGDPVVQFELPQFDFLKDLHILDCSVTLPDDFKGFKCLKTLNLDDVCISETHLRLLIHGSRNLANAQLKLLPIEMEELSVTINNPLLTELRFRILDSVKSVEVVSAPCLQDVRISGEDSSLEELGVVALGFMASIASVSSLTLDYNVLLSCRDGQGYLEPTRYDQCKKLDGFCCFDRTSKSVKIILNTFNYAIGMWMPHLILLNASVLEVMEIKYCSCMEEEVEMIEELHQIKPVSPEAKLIIRDPSE